MQAIAHFIGLIIGVLGKELIIYIRAVAYGMSGPVDSSGPMFNVRLHSGIRLSIIHLL